MNSRQTGNGRIRSVNENNYRVPSGLVNNYRPLKSRNMASRPNYVNSRQEQYKLDQQLIRELRLVGTSQATI